MSTGTDPGELGHRYGSDTPSGNDSRIPSKVRRGIFTLLLFAFAGLWIFALLFASKATVNKIEDEAWTVRAEAICAEVEPQLRQLEMEASAEAGVRADLIVQSTDLLSTMLDDMSAAPPADAKGQAIVPDWIDDYRTLLDDRYAYADRVRDGEIVPFTETAVQGVPITERIETFANENRMPSCAPPRGSVV